MPRPITYAAVLLAALFTAAGPLAAQTTTGTLHESAFARARRAAELRDSLLRVAPPSLPADTQSLVPEPMRRFLDDPYRNASTIITLAGLDSALARVNRTLIDQRKGERKGGGFSGESPNEAAGAAAAAARGAAWLPTPLDLAVGVTDFLVERAKDEVAFGFVITLRNNVRRDDFIRVALPRSHDLMTRIESETFQSYMPLLHSAFVEDLNELPARSDAIANGLSLDSKQRLYLQGVSLAYTRGLEIRRGAPPAVALSNLIDVTPAQMSDSTTRRALRMVGLLAREYAGAGGETVVQELTQRDRGWVRRYFVSFIGRDLIALDAVSKADSMLQLLSSREADAILLLSQIHDVRSAVRDLNGAGGATPGGEPNDEQTTDRAVALAGAVLAVLRTAPRFTYAPGERKSDSVTAFEAFVSDATLLHQALTQRDYGTLVTWLIQNPHFRLCPAQVTVDDANSGAARTCRTRLRYLSFAASVAAARSSAEVTTALRTASAPVGSYRAKRSQTGAWLTPRSASITGYLGLSRYQTARAGERGGGNVDTGIGLPFGPEVSFGTPWGALSLFVPIVDLGPVANERIGLADSGSNTEFNTDELFSPGLMVVFNAFRNLPFSIGAGVESVRRDNGDITAPRRVSVLRSVVFVGVDATLFHFRF